MDFRLNEMMTSLMFLCLVLWCPSGVHLQVTVYGVINTQVVVRCSVPSTAPFWEGPPNLAPYFNQDDPGTVNPGLWNKDRLSVNSDGDLVISSVMTNDSGIFRCSHSGEINITDVKIGCPLLAIPTNGYVNSTFGYPGETAFFRCNDTFILVGQEILTCLSDGSWTSSEPNCGKGTTTTTTTTITSSATGMMTISAISSTTSSLLTSTTSISNSTTTTVTQTTVTSTKSTVEPTSISRGTFTRTSPVTTVPYVSDGDSDKAVVTMIIVVSVIGGILIVAIFSILFVMMHRKSCFTIRGHSKQYAQRSDHWKQHRQAEYNTTGRIFTSRQDHAMRGYYFYHGTYKNPLFYDPFENSSYVNNYYPN